MRKRVGQIGTLFGFLLIVVFSFAPVKTIAYLPLKDKSLHLLAYAVVAFLMQLTTGQRGRVVFLAISTLGALIEVFQPLFGRSFDFFDIVANCVGALLGVSLAIVYQKLKETRVQRGLIERVKTTLMDASIHLEEGLVKQLQWMSSETARKMEEAPTERAAYEASLEVLAMIQENLRLADVNKMAMCQDTGMVVAFVEIGTAVPLSMHAIERAIYQGAEEAIKEGLFRNSVVKEPVFARENTNTNLPPIIYWSPSQAKNLKISLMLKGFGSENCSALAMLNPTASQEGVIEAVAQIVKEAGGKPCPPIVVGVGLGGTSERAALLSKKALLREVGLPHEEANYADLEQKIMDKIQTLKIGPGGFGGPLTALAVAIEYEPTHIAGLPVAVSISCWAGRKGSFIWEGPYV